MQVELKIPGHQMFRTPSWDDTLIQLFLGEGCPKLR